MVASSEAANRTKRQVLPWGGHSCRVTGACHASMIWLDRSVPAAASMPTRRLSQRVVALASTTCLGAIRKTMDDAEGVHGPDVPPFLRQPARARSTVR
jgi:hypothetical protein